MTKLKLSNNEFHLLFSKKINQLIEGGTVPHKQWSSLSMEIGQN